MMHGTFQDLNPETLALPDLTKPAAEIARSFELMPTAPTNDEVKV